MEKKTTIPDTKTAIPHELLDQLLALGGGSEGLGGPEGLLKQLTGALVSRALEGELEHHLGYRKGEKAPEGQDNRRNGKTSKTLHTAQGNVPIEVPRDREGSFEPQLVGKHQRHFDGFDDKIISMYARGMTVRDIRAHLEELYGVDVSPDLISRATESVTDELKAWQSRPLERVYLVVYLDALVLKVRDKGGVRNKSAYLVVGVRTDGHKDILGLWLADTEGAKFWLAILNELKNRGVEDILVLCADGLPGLPDAVEAAFPLTVFQTCIVHVVRSSTRFVTWKDRKEVCADLRSIYTAPTLEAAELALDAFDDNWRSKYPMIATSWRNRWEEITPFLRFPPDMRKAVYTTNAIEALNRQVRKVIKTRSAFPSDDAALKLVFLALRNAQKTWGRPFPQFSLALAQFAIHFEGRLSL